MLLIQNITLEWDKSCRGGKFAEFRNHYPKWQPIEIPIDKSQFKNNDTLIHTVFLIQSKDGISKRFEKLDFKNLNNPKSIDIKYCYDTSSIDYNLPHRQGHNSDFNNINSKFYMRNNINETAFTLEPDTYGRILENGRCRSLDYEMSCWWYQLRIENYISISNLDFTKNIFRKKVDKIYSQMAILF